MAYNGLTVAYQNANIRFKQINKFIKNYNDKLFDHASSKNKNDHKKDELFTNLDDYIREEMSKLIYSHSPEDIAMTEKDETNNNEFLNLVNVSQIRLPIKFVSNDFRSTQSGIKKLFSCIKMKVIKCIFIVI